MSEPTYSIVTVYDFDPRFDNVPWKATATRLSDGTEVATRYSNTEAQAVADVRTVLRRAAEEHPQGNTLYADENGEDCPAPTIEQGSVRA